MKRPREPLSSQQVFMKRVKVIAGNSPLEQRHLDISRAYGTSFVDEGPYEACWVLAPERLKEGIEMGASLIICDMGAIPLHDKKMAKGALIIEGLIKPGICRIGTMPVGLYRKGDKVIVARSKSLGYEAVWRMSQNGEGQALVVQIGEASLEAVIDYFALEDPVIV